MQPRLRPGARRREDVITPAACKRYRSSKVLPRRFYVPREGRRLRLPDPDRPPGSEFTLDKAFAQPALYAGIIKARSSTHSLERLGQGVDGEGGFGEGAHGGQQECEAACVVEVSVTSLAVDVAVRGPPAVYTKYCPTKREHRKKRKRKKGATSVPSPGWWQASS
jgi:hypothetical protein